MTTLNADLFFSFRSPYSYLSIGRYIELAQNHNISILLRPVYPLAIRQPDFFEKNHPNWLTYTMLDMKRVAEFYGIPFKRPKPDPIIQDVETRKIARNQPYIWNVTRLAYIASQKGRGLEFAFEVSSLIWGGTQNWHQRKYLHEAACRAGLSLSELELLIDKRELYIDNEIKANQRSLEDCGHWGVPTLVFRGEPFFGQDRIEIAKWRMMQSGLKRL